MTQQFVKKKVDSRVRTLIENNVKTGHRSIFLMIGDHGKDQIMYLHYMLSKARISIKPSVLWCYKKELGFSSHRKKRMKQHLSKVKKGLAEYDTQDPFELFISSTNIRYCYYKESDKILGNTFGMCVLQDFEALTPNLLAKTVETVEGGGIIVFLLKSLKSLKQLYSMTMDIHSRYRTDSHNDVVGRFNERFILSLGNCENCLVLDDEMNVLPLSSGRDIKALEEHEIEKPFVQELIDMKSSLKDTEPLNSLIKPCKTVDQARAVMTFIEAISEKTLSSTVALTAARGRGKSAALGISIASAIAHGYSNIFVTSPSPENLKTLFEFVLKTFDSLGYEEHMDYTILQSTNPDFNNAIVRVNIFKTHRQTIQYIQPNDYKALGQAELVVIDEAAAIPLPVVKNLIGPYLVFMASTVNGYEGTGRSLTLKLLKQLREQSRGFNDSKSKESSTSGGRVLREVKLEEPIRYSPSDPVELWLNKTLCLDVSTATSSSFSCPNPEDCELYIVNRDTLFSYHPVSEEFLQRMMSLFVASHYKNSPNDLQLLSDAPAHNIFVLLGPSKEGDDNEETLPEPLAVIQVCLEGEISKEALLSSLKRGKRADGDLIPWTISQQFQDDGFATLSGGRIVRIATNPDYTRMGYGTRALQLLSAYYEGLIPCENNGSVQLSINRIDDATLEESVLHTESLRIKEASDMPPLLLSLSEVPAPNLQWLGVSYGLSPELHKFWKRNMYLPVYLRQTTNELTGEHTCIMLRSLNEEQQWVSLFYNDFKKRFLRLLSFKFREFSTVLSLNIIEAKNTPEYEQPFVLTKELLERELSPFDIKRLDSYANNLLDYHVILDLMPVVAFHYFQGMMGGGDEVQLSAVQRAILLGIGLQHKTVEEVATDVNLPVSQLLALFIRSMRKFCNYYLTIKKKTIELEMLPLSQTELDNEENWDPTIQTLQEDLNEGAKESMQMLKKKQKDMIDSLNLSQFEISVTDQDIADSLSNKKIPKVLSVKNENSSKIKRKFETAEDISKSNKADQTRQKSKKKK